MNEMLTFISAIITIIASAALFIFAVKGIMPRFVIKRRYFLGDRLGRGVKKYVSGESRAVVYEPAPSVRKYVKKYALVKSGGQKYLKCRVDECVRTMKYNVVMLDNRGRVIDVLEVDEAPNRTGACVPIFLHRATSYVAITVKSVNDMMLEDTETSYYLVRDIGIFALAIGALSFIEMLVVSNLVSVAASAASGGSMHISAHPASLIGAAFLIAVLSVVVLLLHCNKNNVRILLNDK